MRMRGKRRKKEKEKGRIRGSKEEREGVMEGRKGEMIKGSKI